MLSLLKEEGAFEPVVQVLAYLDSGSDHYWSSYKKRTPFGESVKQDDVRGVQN